MCGLNLGCVCPICQVVTALFPGSLKNNNLFQVVLPPPVIHVKGFLIREHSWESSGQKIILFSFKVKGCITITLKVSAEK